ncbi:MAG: helix-turn-helix transcriptional regulator [Bacteroidales bacterium]|nr:helix-turn-helix transcriptional regulator [Bacteroidales bacterium]
MRKINLKLIRKKHGLTQAKLCELVGYNQGFVSLMERGKVSVPEVFIQKLVKALKIEDIEEFIEEIHEEVKDTPEPVPYPEIKKASMGERILDIIERYEQKIENLEARIRELENENEKLKHAQAHAHKK